MTKMTKIEGRRRKRTRQRQMSSLHITVGPLKFTNEEVKITIYSNSRLGSNVHSHTLTLKRPAVNETPLVQQLISIIQAGRTHSPGRVLPFEELSTIFGRQIMERAAHAHRTLGSIADSPSCECEMYSVSDWYTILGSLILRLPCGSIIHNSVHSPMENLSTVVSRVRPEALPEMRYMVSMRNMDSTVDIIADTKRVYKLKHVVNDMAFVIAAQDMTFALLKVQPCCYIGPTQVTMEAVEDYIYWLKDLACGNMVGAARLWSADIRPTKNGTMRIRLAYESGQIVLAKKCWDDMLAQMTVHLYAWRGDLQAEREKKELAAELEKKELAAESEKEKESVEATPEQQTLEPENMMKLLKEMKADILRLEKKLSAGQP